MSGKSIFIAGAVATALVVGGVYAVANLETVPAGYVGVKVNLYGSEKGVQNEELGVGRYLLTWNEQCYLFPTFNQLHTYSVPFTFQTSDAMAVNAKIGVEYQVRPSMATKVFQTYRKGVEEITEVNLRQNVSDALIKYASLMDVNELTANGKTKLLEHVTEELRCGKFPPDTTTVHRHKRLVLTPAMLLDQLCDRFFSATVRSKDHDGTIQRSHTTSYPLGLPDRPAKPFH